MKPRYQKRDLHKIYGYYRPISIYFFISISFSFINSASRSRHFEIAEILAELAETFVWPNPGLSGALAGQAGQNVCQFAQVEQAHDQIRLQTTIESLFAVSHPWL